MRPTRIAEKVGRRCRNVRDTPPGAGNPLFGGAADTLPSTEPRVWSAAVQKPSETQRGRAWLSNFAPSDRAAAARLLDSLKFVSGTEFRAAMGDMIADHIDALSQIGPIALHPVRNDKIFREDPFAGERGLIGAGSALIALNITEKIAEAYGPHVSLAPKLNELRDGRVRNIILIDDLIGSGRSVIECVNRWRANPTIRSWYSYRLIEFHLVAYSYCQVGYDNIAQSDVLKLENFRSHSIADDFSRTGWTPEEEQEIRRICYDYANNWRNAFGVGNAEALIVFDHTVPNNLPRILLQEKDKSGNPWKPFFALGSRRQDPAQAAELAGYSPYTRRPHLTADGSGLVESELDILDRDMATVLRAVESGLTLSRQIQQVTYLTDFQIRVLVDRARSLGLVGPRVALTASGFEWLRERRHEVADTPEEDPAYYYPVQLRGVDGV